MSEKAPAPTLTPPALDSLNPRQRDAVLNYTDPNSPTYGVKSTSVSRAYPNMTEGSAAAHSAQLFKKPIVQTAVAELLAQNNASYNVRLTAEANLALNRETEQIITEHKDADGNVIQTTTVRKPVPASVRLKALQGLREHAGDNAVATSQNKLMSQELLKLGKRMLKASVRTVTDVTPADTSTYTDADTGMDAHQGTGIGEGAEGQAPNIPCTPHMSEPKITGHTPIDMQDDTHEDTEEGVEVSENPGVRPYEVYIHAGEGV